MPQEGLRAIDPQGREHEWNGSAWIPVTAQPSSPAEGRTLSKEALQAFEDYGGFETVAGLAGGAVGGIPGAMGAAALTRALRGALAGEDPTSIGINAVLQGGTEALPVLGKPLKWAGKRLMRSAIPVSMEMATELGGKAGLAAGRDAIVERIRNMRGMRLGPAHKQLRDDLAAIETNIVGPKVAEATAAGTTINPEPIWEAGRRQLEPGGSIASRIGSPSMESGAKSVLDRFVGQTSEEVPIPDAELMDLLRSGVTNQATKRVPRPLTPTDVRGRLSATPYVTGDPDVPGAPLMTRELRVALSNALKGAVPGIKEAFEQQTRGIPVRDAMDLALFQSGGGRINPELIYSGGSTPRVLAVLPASREFKYTESKIADAIGSILGSPRVPGVTRLGAGLVMPSNEPQRRQLK